ncbi:hypothetical protein NL529_32545, partial [Klebsiella pneumoniae]|nr:hypothetical protein [Klebsiella pneumoniae]
TPELATPIEVTPGAQINSIDIHLRKTRTVRVRGKVMSGASGKPVQNAMVRFTPRSDATFDFMPRMARVDQGGTFSATGLTA